MEELGSSICSGMQATDNVSPDKAIDNNYDKIVADSTRADSTTKDAEMLSDDELEEHLNSNKKRKNVLTDSEDEKLVSTKTVIKTIVKDYSSSEDDDLSINKRNTTKSRIKAMSSSEDEDKGAGHSDSESSLLSKNKIIQTQKQQNGTNADSSSEDERTNKLSKPKSDSESSSSEQREQQMRTKNKRNTLTQKFKNLISSRNGSDKIDNKSENGLEASDSQSGSANSDNEASSIEKIKQKIKERSYNLKSTIYDPDTSDDEQALSRAEQNKQRKKNKKNESTKPVRMSAKQAMENMHKIKSESNRMLREKEVSLPYHRPKALSLKDIMSRRKPALAADGKALPLKMNEDQLRQYARLLEERQKEMIELCKSESEGEEDNANDSSEGKTENLEQESSTVEINGEKEKLEDFNSEKESAITEGNKDEQSVEDSTDNLKDVSQANDELFDSQISKTNETSLYESAIDDTMKDNEESKEMESSEKHNTEPDSQFISLQYDSENVETDTPNNVLDNLVEKIQENNDVNDLKEKALENGKGESPKPDDITEVEESSVKDTLTEGNVDAKFKSQDTNQAMDVSDVNVGEEIEETSKENISIEDKIDGFSDEEDGDMDMADIDKMIEEADIIVENATQNGAVDSPMLVRDNFRATISKPKLTGAPGMVIDLDGNDATEPKKQSGIELLKERFTFFAKLKTPEEIERIRNNRVKPGIQHLKLKQELEEQIAEQRSIEWHKRLDEEKQHQAEMDAIRGDVSDEDDIEKIEAKLEDTDDKIDESEGESEPEENDVILEDKPQKKNPLLEDEAEESDVEEDGRDDNDADDENGDENGENGDENVETDEESSDDSSDDELDTAKPKKGRILKAFEDSDDEENQVNNEENKEVSQEVISVIIESSKSVIDPVENDLALEKESENNDNFSSQDIELNSAQLHKSISEDMFASQDSDIKSKTTVDVPKIDPCNGIETNKLSVICETQPYEEANFEEIAGMCSGSFSQNSSTLPVEPTQSKSLEIGDNVLALCTGKFYDNQFVSQGESSEVTDEDKSPIKDKENEKKPGDGKLLQSLLLELDDPEFDNPKPNKFFTGGNSSDKQVEAKKRYVIDSDDEDEKPAEVKKNKRRKKLQDRALQISDDEEEEQLGEEEEELISDLDDDEENEGEKLVEYDSEENEVQMQPNQVLPKKKKRKTTDFFEQEAELTSEDEWVGSGDEDEAGLDRMEREEGDADTFHQGRLQRELGQIHMREVMDQDKREVRLLQELLMEDGDLGGGSRQRKFRWRNADGEEEIGTKVDEFGESQEEEFESEEQWRKQRHERAVFLKQMMEKEGAAEETLNVSFNRSALIKASLVQSTTTVNLDISSTENDPVQETDKKTAKDVPSPVKKPFALLQPNFRGSILARGSGTLARLSALAAPIATDGDEKVKSLGPPSKRNFVFSAVSPAQDKPKVTKRKADGIAGTPKLMKKLKTDEKRRVSARSSLLDHFKT